MGFIFDIITVVILLLSIYLGYKKGLVNVGFNLLAIIVSILITITLYSPITQLVINNTELDENIENFIIENGTAEAIQNSTESDSISAFLQKYSQNIAQKAQNSAVQSVASVVAKNVVGIIVIIGLFIATRVVLMLLKTFTNIVAKVPVIKQFNEFAGIIYGLLRGLILIYGILAIIFFIGTVGGNTALNSAIENSYVTKFFYDNNFILKLLF